MRRGDIHSDIFGFVLGGFMSKMSEIHAEIETAKNYGFAVSQAEFFAVLDRMRKYEVALRNIAKMDWATEGLARDMHEIAKRALGE